MSSDTFYIYFLCYLALLVYHIFFSNTKQILEGMKIMLVVRNIICMLTIITLVVAQEIYARTYERTTYTTLAYKIVIGIAVVLGITSIVLMMITPNSNFITCIVIVLLYLVCWGPYDHWRSWIGIVIIVISFIGICGLSFITNEKGEVPDATTTTYTYPVICTSDSSSIEGSTSESIYCFQGSVAGKSVYKCYYQLPDGGIQQDTIPAESTKIYFVESGKNAYLETTVITEYQLVKDDPFTTRLLELDKKTYKLYVPEGSIITNVFEFDAE